MDMAADRPTWGSGGAGGPVPNFSGRTVRVTRVGGGGFFGTLLSILCLLLALVIGLVLLIPVLVLGTVFVIGFVIYVKVRRFFVRREQPGGAAAPGRKNVRVRGSDE